MALHGLRHLTIGVPDPARTAAFYADFGLVPAGSDGPGAGIALATRDGGEQLRLVPAPHRRLVQMVVGVDDADDLDRASTALRVLGHPARRSGAQLRSVEPVSGSEVVLQVAERTHQQARPAPAYNGPGRVDRATARADVTSRTEPVRPLKLGHVVLGTPDPRPVWRFFVDGIGFKVSDRIGDTAAFLRCSQDHHNLLVTAAPVTFLHHTSWQVLDVDEVGRGATAMLEADPNRHVWGLGRHCAGSNFFWYLRDPAGNFAEYYSDMDVIVDDALWKPDVFEGARGLYQWGPPPPPSFLHPEDLAALMTGAHSA